MFGAPQAGTCLAISPANEAASYAIILSTGLALTHYYSKHFSGSAQLEQADSLIDAIKKHLANIELHHRRKIEQQEPNFFPDLEEMTTAAISNVNILKERVRSAGFSVTVGFPWSSIRKHIKEVLASLDNIYLDLLRTTNAVNGPPEIIPVVWPPSRAVVDQDSDDLSDASDDDNGPREQRHHRTRLDEWSLRGRPISPQGTEID